MKIISVASLIFACLMSGCSFYDVTTLAADAALGNGLFSDENRNEDDWDGLWDEDTSQCIRDEKKLRPIMRQLDAIEEGREIVILPTGEKYQINDRLPREESLPGPTSTCLARTSD